MIEKKIPVIAIIGPTAVGKTAFSINLAKKINAEIVSVDSRQVYRYLDVGTDKIDVDTRHDVIHHLIDIVDPDQVYSAADFARDASDSIKRILGRGKVPLLVGGSALYYRALEGALSEDLPKDKSLREKMELEIKNNGLLSLYEELKNVDFRSAEKIHPNDSIRIMRAVEVYRLTGKPITWWYDRQNRNTSEFDIFYIGLNRPRTELYENIATRVHKQFYSGYPEEVEWLLSNGFSPKLPSLLGFGYKELVLYHRGKISFETAIERDIKATKIYARRQMTWFKHFTPCQWYNVSQSSVSDIMDDVYPKCQCFLRRD